MMRRKIDKLSTYSSWLEVTTDQLQQLDLRIMDDNMPPWMKMCDEF